MIDLKPTCRELATLVAGVTDDQLSRSTASDGWRVRDLLDHLDQVARGFAGIAGSAPEMPDDADVVARILALGRAWDDPAAWQGRSGEGVLDLPRGRPVEISADAPLIDQVVAATGRRP